MIVPGHMVQGRLQVLTRINDRDDEEGKGDGRKIIPLNLVFTIAGDWTQKKHTRRARNWVF